jgi:hypothetical protein
LSPARWTLQFAHACHSSAPTGRAHVPMCQRPRGNSLACKPDADQPRRVGNTLAARPRSISGMM